MRQITRVWCAKCNEPIKIVKKIKEIVKGVEVVTVMVRQNHLHIPKDFKV